MTRTIDTPLEDVGRAMLAHAASLEHCSQVLIARYDTDDGVIANSFHQAVRNGASSPAAVLVRVQQHLEQQRASGYGSPDRREECALLLERLQTERQDALTYAAAVLAYEALPPDERARRKAARADVHLEAWMAAQPATEKQRNYLHMLGHRASEPLSKRDASALIDALLHQREDLL